MCLKYVSVGQNTSSMGQKKLFCKINNVNVKRIKISFFRRVNISIVIQAGGFAASKLFLGGRGVNG